MKEESMLKFDVTEKEGRTFHVEFDPGNLALPDVVSFERALSRHAADLVWYLSLQSMQQRVVGEIKSLLDNKMAVEYMSVREALEKTSSKRPTEAEVNSRVAANEEVIELKEMLADAQYKQSLLSGIVNAMSQQTKILITFGAHLRASSSGELSFSEEVEEYNAE